MSSKERLQLRLRWGLGCPDCGSVKVRHASFQQAILNGKGIDRFTCLDCGHHEEAEDLEVRE